MNTNKIKGGKVIASGGFGCVFSPALKCINKKRRKNMISKLMIEKYALSEYNEIKKIKEKLDSIPNYLQYFLIGDFSICHPEKLSKQDLHQFKQKCSALPKNNITVNNINESLNKVVSLNMPFGGMPIDDYTYVNISSYEKMTQMNTSLIQLLNNGILPMNKKNIYHSDIKDSNILIDDTKIVYTRLIDWGLSTNYVPYKNDSFPKVWRNRPLQFNVPFSVILFTDAFVEKYTQYLKEHDEIEEDIKQNNLRAFVVDYLFFWIKERGPGHYKYINNIMYMLFSNDLSEISDEKQKINLIETNFTIVYITNYIIEILNHFTHLKENGTLNLRIYLDNVYIKIVDVWGFIIVYVPLLEILFENYKNLNEAELDVFKHMKQIFIQYLYNPRIKEIPIKELSADLIQINNLLKIAFNKKVSSSSNKSYSNKSYSNKRTSHGIISSLRKKYTQKNIKKIRSSMKKKSRRRNSKLLFLSSPRNK